MKGLLLVIALLFAIPLAMVTTFVGMHFDLPEWITENIVYILIGTPLAGLLAIKCRARSERLRLIAEKHNWEFSKTASLLRGLAPSHFSVFNHSRSSLRNTMRTVLKIGDLSLETVLGDCEYTSGRSGIKRHYRKSFVVVSLPCQFMERAMIRPEKMLDKIARGFGFDDIDFESKEFSDAFYVTGSDKRLLYEIVSPRMMKFLLKGHPSGRAVTVEIAYSRLCIATANGKWKPGEFPIALQWAGALLEQFPERLLSPQGKAKQ